MSRQVPSASEVGVDHGLRFRLQMGGGLHQFRMQTRSYSAQESLSGC